jgi:Ca2+-binding RTX toxin-like protein
MRLALVALLFLALAAPASASTAQVVFVNACGNDVACNKYSAQPEPVVTYVAAPGEANRFTVSRAGDEWTLSDPGAPVTAAAGCRSDDAHTAVCTGGYSSGRIPGFSAQLGDGDDSLAVIGWLQTLTSLDGGPGADSLKGGDDPNHIDGGPGADSIDGGRFDLDTLTFAGRREPVTVDVGAGRTSDGDTFSGIEFVVGGEGDDRLIGSRYTDTLTGGAGDDVLRGLGAGDVLDGGLGADDVEGGRGGDIAAGDPPQGDGYYTPRVHLSADIVRGGPGNDVLRDFGGRNLIEGGSGNDMLFGGSGADRLLGGGGRDVIKGGGGVDRFAGGAGDDKLAARDGRHERVDCGRGRDRARVDGKDRVHSCERLG